LKNERLRATVDKMEHRLGRVSTGGPVHSKEARRRLRYEQELGARQQKSIDLDSRIAEQYTGIDSLDARIAEQRTLHRTLKTRIDDERKAPVPNVPRLVQTVEGYRAVAATNRERTAMLGIAGAAYDARMASLRQCVGSMAAREVKLSETQARVSEMQVSVGTARAAVSLAEIKTLEQATAASERPGTARLSGCTRRRVRGLGR